MKITLWSLASSCGDGSSVAILFDSREAAEKYNQDQMQLGYSECDEFENISSHTLDIDENGKIITPNPEVEEY